MGLRFFIIVCAAVLGFGTSTFVLAQEKTHDDANTLPTAEPAQLYDDSWWEKQYAQIYKTEECRGLKAQLEQARAFDQRFRKTTARTGLGFHYWQGRCFDINAERAEELLVNVAEQGGPLATIYLAQFYYLTQGEKAPETQEWTQRSKDTMAQLSPMDWQQFIYMPLKQYLKQNGEDLSPHLETIFTWFENVQNGDANVLFEMGMKLLNNAKDPASKIHACHWFYAAERKGHEQARYQLARQLALGDGVLLAPWNAELFLDELVNVDHNIDAYILLSELLQRGDVYEKHLPLAYASLLRAKEQGGNVSKLIEQLRLQLTKQDIEYALEFTNDSKTNLTLRIVSNQLPLSNKVSQSICSYSSR